jgi:hypothetical protein
LPTASAHGDVAKAKRLVIDRQAKDGSLVGSNYLVTLFSIVRYMARHWAIVFICTQLLILALKEGPLALFGCLAAAAFLQPTY